MKTIMAIDPGNMESADVFWNGREIGDFGKVSNHTIFTLFRPETDVVIEKIACMGMPVGEDVLDTCIWTGRFQQELECHLDIRCHYLKRHEVKMHLCGSTRAKDSNIITALVDRFDPQRLHGKYGKGTKRDPGLFYGFFKDVWQAFALALTYQERDGGAK